MRTYTAKPKEVTRDWFVIDAKDIPIGRLSSRIATILRGKHKTIYTPFIDTGDVVIVINAAQVGSTGNKEKQKVYYRHSGYPGGLKSTTLEKLRIKKPEQIIELAVKNMLPKGPLGRAMYRKLWVYAGADHPHQAQQPKELPSHLNDFAE
jgi:large subunit ribosomal protein L13